MRAKTLFSFFVTIAILCLASTVSAQGTPPPSTGATKAPLTTVTMPAGTLIHSPRQKVMLACVPHTPGVNKAMIRMGADYDTCMKISGASWDSTKCECSYEAGKCAMDLLKADGTPGRDGVPEIYAAAYCEMIRTRKSNTAYYNRLRRQLKDHEKRIKALEKWRITDEKEHVIFKAELKKLKEEFNLTKQEIQGIRSVVYGNSEYEGLLPTQQRILKILFGEDGMGNGLIAQVKKNKEDIARLKTQMATRWLSGFVLNLGGVGGFKFNGGGPIEAEYNNGKTEVARAEQSIGLGATAGIGYLSRLPDSMAYRVGLTWIWLKTSDGNEVSDRWGNFNLVTADFLFGFSENLWLGPSVGGSRHATGESSLESDAVENGFAFGARLHTNMAQLTDNASLAGVFSFHLIYGQSSTNAAGIPEEMDYALGFLFTAGITFDFGFFEDKSITVAPLSPPPAVSSESASYERRPYSE